MVVARRRAIDGCRHLRNTQAQNAARSACGSGADSNQQRRDAGLHQLARGIEGYRIADDDRHPHPLAKTPEVERLVLRRNVPDRGNGGLDDKHVHASLLGDGAVALGFLRNGTHRRDDAGFLYLFHPAGDQFFAYWFLVKLLNERGGSLFVGGDNFGEDLAGILIAGLDALQVKHAQSAKLAHQNGHA